MKSKKPFLCYIPGGLDSNCFALDYQGKPCLPIFDSIDKIDYFASVIFESQNVIAIECDMKKIEDILKQGGIEWVLVNPDVDSKETIYVPARNFIEGIRDQFR